MRLIDADALKEKLQEHHDFFINAWKENGVAPIDIPIPDKSRLDEIINSIAEVVNAPTIEERPKGEWIRETEEDLKNKYRCSICGRRVDEVDDYLLLDEDNRVSDVYPFCHCGARMER